MNPAVYFLILAAMTMALVCISVAVINRCYLVVPADKAIVRSGMGPIEVATAGGMLVYPVIHRVDYMSLQWQPVTIDFASSNPLTFSDSKTYEGKVTVWVSIDTTETSIVEAAQSLGERAGDPNAVNELYRESMKQTIRKVVRDIDHAAWLDNLPEVPSDLMKALCDDVEPFHMVHRVAFTT